MSTSRIPLTKRCQACGYRYERTLTECPLDGATLPPERPSGDRLGAYRLLSRLGTGGMGAVYRAINEKIGRSVAIKTLHRKLLRDPVSVQRFFQEARAVNTIRHPNVVEVHDLASTADDQYLVMEYLRGADLEAALQAAGGAGLPVPRALRILEQVCGALFSAHGCQIVHRDMKPANVFLTRDREAEDFVKLLDFGVAMLGEGSSGRLTAEGSTVGTPEYMAPEQARGRSVDHRADIYAVGCIAYEMLTGRPPIAGASATEIMLRHLQEQPPPLRALRPELPEALEAAVLRCLAKDPDARPQSMVEVAQGLCAAAGLPFDTTGSFEEWREWMAARTTNTQDLLRTSTAPELITGQAASGGTRRPRGGRRALIAGGAALLLGVALLVGPRLPSEAVEELAPPAGTMAKSGLARPSIAPGLLGAAPAMPARGSATPGSPPAAGPPDPARVRLLLQSTPAGAKVQDDRGRILGVTPYLWEAPVGEPHVLRLSRAGFRAVERRVVAREDGTIVFALEPDARPPADRPLRRAAAAARSAPRAASRPPDVVDDSGSQTLDPF